MNTSCQKLSLRQAAARLARKVSRARFGRLYSRVMVSLCLLASAPTLVLGDGEMTAPELLADSTGQSSWRFRVWLDDKEIGYHHFYLAQDGDLSQVRTEADFEYKLLFVKLYDYEHVNRENWKGDCLQSIESSTDANGEPFSVSGHLQTGEFELTGSNGASSLPACIMSFAYWNPEFLKQDYLLNSQNGEYLEVEVSTPVLEDLEVRGKQQASYRYSLQAGTMKVDLWYSIDDHWLALESEARGGRIIRYELL